MDKSVKKLYNYTSKRIEVKEFEDGFKFDLNDKEHYIMWDEDSLCVIDVINGDMDGAYEFSYYDLQMLLN